MKNFFKLQWMQRRSNSANYCQYGLRTKPAPLLIVIFSSDSKRVACGKLLILAFIW
ncbi:hypothetical protein RchiOBHm_Chr2g0137971 [Rosa chinensis]|uniref:Uncharacterized protein n=1 Tax=Rosa chinensis TaxID=74649 RepID=A0A2P6RWR3_ROSCH|nr:hypothetical protein RchiOBHm_Chr2g0137971 [Rosa chinensis]